MSEDAVCISAACLTTHRKHVIVCEKWLTKSLFAIFVPGRTKLRQALKSLLSWVWCTRTLLPFMPKATKMKLQRKYYGDVRGLFCPNQNRHSL
jgi:hypothetical protein